LTHKDLHLHPVAGQYRRQPMPGRDGAWFGMREWPALGLPAPVRRLLESSSRA
jgi:A/G-specific adenine glycosylase